MPIISVSDLINLILQWRKEKGDERRRALELITTLANNLELLAERWIKIVVSLENECRSEMREHLLSQRSNFQFLDRFCEEVRKCRDCGAERAQVCDHKCLPAIKSRD